MVATKQFQLAHGLSSVKAATVWDNTIAQLNEGDQQQLGKIERLLTRIMGAGSNKNAIKDASLRLVLYCYDNGGK